MRSGSSTSIAARCAHRAGGATRIWRGSTARWKSSARSWTPSDSAPPTGRRCWTVILRRARARNLCPPRVRGDGVRRLYTLLVVLALPVATLLVLWRGLRDRNYWRGWGGGGGRGGGAPSAPRPGGGSPGPGGGGAARPAPGGAPRAPRPGLSPHPLRSAPAGGARAPPPSLHGR